MIRLDSISKTLSKGSPNETKIFRELNLDILKNDFIILVGSNGSGKSTLLNLLAGTMFPDNGKIFFDENDVTRIRDYKRSKWIARIFQNPNAGTAPELSILENFRLASLRTKSKGLSIGTGDKFKSHVREKVSFLNLGLENKLNMVMGNLSGGQRQALTLLMAIMDETKLLLLDEPIAALDPPTSELILKLASKVIQDYDLTAVLVTHQIKDVIGFGNRVIQLKEGQIIRDFKKNAEHELNMKDIYEWFGE